MRTLAVVVTVIIGLTALGMAWHSPLAVGALLAAVALSVSTNGLAFTAVAELAGLAWAGRALGVQNTGQNLAAAVTPPVLAQLIDGIGYGGAFRADHPVPGRSHPGRPHKSGAPAGGTHRRGTHASESPHHASEGHHHASEGHPTEADLSPVPEPPAGPPRERSSSA